MKRKTLLERGNEAGQMRLPMKGIFCKFCDGSGQVNDEDIGYTVDCAECGGSGKRKPSINGIRIRSKT
jgi:DnaJ-class molecular chaperone